MEKNTRAPRVWFWGNGCPAAPAHDRAPFALIRPLTQPSDTAPARAPAPVAVRALPPALAPGPQPPLI